MSQRSQRPGETPDTCRKRVMNECLQQWRDTSESGKALHEEYRQKAIEFNKTNSMQVARHQTTEHVLVSPVPDTSTHVCVPSIQAFASKGCGPLGIGDERFGLSVALLSEKVDQSVGFVKNSSAAWKTCAGGTIVSNETFDVPMKLSCFEEFGFCWNTVGNKARYTKIEQHLLRFIQEYRKLFLYKKKNLGPNANIKHLLLIAIKDNWKLGSRY